MGDKFITALTTAARCDCRAKIGAEDELFSYKGQLDNHLEQKENGT